MLGEQLKGRLEHALAREYGDQVLDNTIAVLGRLTTVDDLIGEWAAHNR
jgi:hypothetical protein